MYGECHAHIFMNGHNYKEAVEQHKNHVCEESIRRNLQEYQKRGVTFIRDGGDALGVSERAMELAPEYGIDYRTPIFAIHKKGHYGGIVGLGFESMTEYHDLVKQVRQRKGHFIKIMTSGIMDLNQYGVVTGLALAKKEVKEMVHIAHEEGFSVMAHVNTASAVMDAIEAEADSVEHGNYMDEECIHALVGSQTVWVPTLATVRNLFGCGRYPDSVLFEIYRTGVKNLKKAYREGVMLALGSDAGAYRVNHGQGIADEYRIFQEFLGDDEGLLRRLKTGERKIRDRF